MAIIYKGPISQKTRHIHCPVFLTAKTLTRNKRILCKMSSLRRSPGNGLEYYFAYGSNMHFAQMASRCKGSSFEGMATLFDYRWQINERGYANVIISEGDWVEGLVYIITETDKRALDRYEGVSRGCYDVKKMSLQFKAEAQSHNKSDVAGTETQTYTHDLKDGLDNSPTAKNIGQPGRGSQQDGQPQRNDFSHDHALINRNYKDRRNQHRSGERPEFDEPPVTSPEEDEAIMAVVYYSSNFTQDGDILPEYVFRMNNAIADALANGVSAKYITKYIKPVLPDSSENAAGGSIVSQVIPP
jgi:gamma-glutamylcyclotransferase (GGCT)/AIG2-like uncharacterized protein YtfP